MYLKKKTMLCTVSSISLSLLLFSPVMAFDFGKIVSDSLERTVDKTVRSVENSVSNEIEKALSSAIPKVAPNAKQDDGQKKDLSKGVIIFGFNGCPHCRKAYAFLKRNNIPYELLDVQKDKKAKRTAQQNGIRGVPVIFVSGERFSGFSEGGYQKLFKKHGVLK